MAPDGSVPAGEAGSPPGGDGGDPAGTCPRCGDELEGVDARSARDVRAEPCGCRVGHVRVRRVFGTADGVVPDLAVPPR